MSTIEVKVPDIGDFKDVPVIEIFVKPGDTVKAEDSLVSLESDKATIDVPSPIAGTVKEVRVKVGDKVSQGSLIVVLEAVASEPSPQPSPAGERGSGATASSVAEPAPSPQPSPASGRGSGAAAPVPGGRAVAPNPEKPRAKLPLPAARGRGGPGVRAQPPTPATWISNARRSSWAPAPAATAPHSAPPISA